MGNKSDTRDRIATLDSQITQLLKLKQQYQDIERNAPIAQNSNSLWSKINDELSGLDSSLLKSIAENNEYQKLNNQINAIVQEELLLLVKDKVENRQDGKELLAKQLQTIKDIKVGITKEQQEELLLFNKFKKYVKLHPNTTYEEFLTKVN